MKRIQLRPFDNHENAFFQSFVETRFGMNQFGATNPNLKKNKHIAGKH